MDVLDEQILDLLGLDARRTYKSIAKETDISEVAVKKRIDHMIEEGVIKRFTIAVDPQKIGVNVRATINLDVKPNQIEKIIKKMKTKKEFYSIWKTVGAHNIHVRGAFCDLSHMNQAIEETLDTNGVIKYHTSILVKQKQDRTYVYSTPKGEKVK